MSALAGIWRVGGGTAPSGTEGMLRGMAKFGRGPAGIWRSNGIELARRLMPTLPEDAADRQPYAGGNGSLRLVADIRLDNRREVASSLGLSQVDAAALADADLLMRAWEHYGADCLDRLTGDYAFALWDAASHHLLLVRDPAGSRPLFYHESRDFFAFASLPSGLLALPEVPCVLDEDRLIRGALHLAGRTENSFFKGIRSVRPGEILVVAIDGVHRRQYWRPEQIKPLHFKNPDDYAKALREALDRAVQSQMRGVGEVAAQLSAGLDSSCITSTAARILAQENRRLVAFTAAPRQGYHFPAPPGRLTDEAGHAAAVATMHGNIDHVIRRSGSATPFDNLDRYFSLFQQPTLNLCNHVWMDDIWTAAAERGLRTMLTGLLGNATISFRSAAALRSLTSPKNWSALMSDSIGLIAGGHVTLRGIAGELLGPMLPGRLWALLIRQLGGWNSQHASYVAANPHLLHEQGAIQRNDSIDDWGRLKYGRDPRQLILASGDIAPLNKGVLAGWGVDLRQPAIDRRVIEVCLALPLREFVRNGVPGAIYHRAFAGRLPPMLLQERRRGLQASDWHERLAAGRVKLLAEIDRIDCSDIARRILDLPRLRRLAATLPERSEDYLAATPALRFVLLRGVALGHFIRRAGEGRSALIVDDTKPQELV